MSLSLTLSFININLAFVFSFLTAFYLRPIIYPSTYWVSLYKPFGTPYSSFGNNPSIHFFDLLKNKRNGKTVPLNILYFVPDKLLFRLFTFSRV